MIQWLRGTQRKIQQLTLEVATATREIVWERTHSRIYGMSGAEARGYARARARLIVSRSTDSMLSDRGVSLSSDARHQIVTTGSWIDDTASSQLRRPPAAPLRLASGPLRDRGRDPTCGTQGVTISDNSLGLYGLCPPLKRELTT